MPRLNFTIDSALLRELGERLVGKPHIALAELVKNSYDADASEVTIEFAPDEDRIEVRDDGHGMDLDEFRDFWMRIGTPHKGEKRLSKYLKRPMTGSKGVGRLAVQLLAQELTITTVPKEYEGEWLEAYVDWEQAVEAEELTEATVEYTQTTSPPPFEHGTSIVLSKLKHTWGVESIRDLAAELWWLQPPFRSPSLGRDDTEDSFAIRFQSTQREFEEAFDKQMWAILGIWTARLVGTNEKGQVTLSLEYAGETPEVYTYAIADFPHNAGRFDEEKNLNDGTFEIRIFKLAYRQPHGIRVGEAREYFSKYGGVHVYDGGFRLPYYGTPESDWLRIEIDHSHRLFVSKLLPKALQFPQGLRALPTLGRIFGVVNVDTSGERNLNIMITRDRLAESTAFEDLVAMVRYAIDLYANEETRRKFERKQLEAPIEPTSLKFERVEQVLEYYEPQIPNDVYQDLREKVQEATTAATASQEVALRQMGLLGPLATAGISALAYQHELRKQFSTIESIIERIAEVRTSDASLRRSLDSLREDLSSWLGRARATNALFDYLADAENIKTTRRFRAAAVVEDVKAQTEFLARGIEIDTSEIDDELLLPEASLAEWGAIFQNVFTNAFNAMLDSEERLLRVSSRTRGRSREILVQDTGIGVDLQNAEELFQPFERKLEVSPERRGLGYGGTGLGLTIVRLLADRIGCKVGFVEPDDGFSTAFSISWRETA
ncbi:MAG: ATP-binding protein [Bacteroidota bacterium]